MSSAPQTRSDCSARELRNIRDFGVLADFYDTLVNPLLALEERYLRQMLPNVAGLDVLDAGCGSGRWLNNLASTEAHSLTGIDPSAEMLHVARQKKLPGTQLIQSGCEKIPLPEQSFDLILSSFVMSYIEDFACAVSEVDRIARVGCDLFLSDMHPETQRQLGWKRAFQHKTDDIVFDSFSPDLHKITAAFEDRGWKICAAIEPRFGSPEKQLFEIAGRLESFFQAELYPAIFILHLRKQESTLRNSPGRSDSLLCGARLALGAAESVDATLRIVQGSVVQVLSDRLASHDSEEREINLADYMVMPGLINAHDHLEFALFPRLANPPYVNASAWAVDIQETFRELIVRHRSVPKEVRLWWGGIRNLLCGVTTVCHHNAPEAELYGEDFPVRVLQNFGWSHSLTFGGDVRANRAATPAGYPFVVHACEGTDQAAMEELGQLDGLGILDKDSVLVHALPLDDKGISLLRDRGASVIICPSSNDYLFGRVPDISRLERVGRIALGNDSPLTALGDLLDEIRFAVSRCDLSPQSAYNMVTKEASNILHLRNAAGSIKVSGAADLIAIRDTDCDAADRLYSLSAKDVELVMIGGRVQLSSPSMLDRIPKSMSSGLEPLWIDGTVRWLRAPVGHLLRRAGDVLGIDAVRLGGKRIRSPRQEELSYAR